jgi:diadenosine tetraphosphate (Ap4A) HIT family hydrolase
VPGPIGVVPGTLIETGKRWSLVLNRNQNLLGKCMIVLNRQETDVTRLSEAEWIGLRRYLQRLTAALDSLFQPDIYNFAFLMNEDRWVHLHVVPRYESPREWAGERFDDPHFGSLFGTELRILDTDALLRLSSAVAGALEGKRVSGTLPSE